MSSLGSGGPLKRPSKVTSGLNELLQSKSDNRLSGKMLIRAISNKASKIKELLVSAFGVRSTPHHLYERLCKSSKLRYVLGQAVTRVEQNIEHALNQGWRLPAGVGEKLSKSPRSVRANPAKWDELFQEYCKGVNFPNTWGELEKMVLCRDLLLRRRRANGLLLKDKRQTATVSEIEILYEISDLLIQEHNGVKPFLDQVLSKVNKLIESDIGFIYLVQRDEKDKEDLILITTSGMGEKYERWRERYVERLKVGGDELQKHERSFIGYVVHTKLAMRSANVRKEIYYRESNNEIISELAVPITLGEDVLGVINLESHIKDFYSEEHTKFLCLVARLIPRQLESLMVREGRRKPLAHLIDKVTSGIREIMREIPSSLPLEVSGILNEVASIVASSLNSEKCTIWLLDDSEKDLVLCGSYDPRGIYIGKIREETSKDFMWRAIKQESFLKSSPSNNPGKERLVWPFIVTPLFIRGKAIGAIIVELKNGIPVYTEVDEQLLNVIQGHIADAIELYRLEAERDEKIQEHFNKISNLLEEVFTGYWDLKIVLRKAVEVVPRLCNGDSCSIFLWDQYREVFVLEETNQLPSHLIKEASYKPGEGLTGWVGKHGMALMLDNKTREKLKEVAPDLEWKAKYDHLSGSTTPPEAAFLAVPILMNGQSVGVIRICYRHKGSFTESDKYVVTLVASKIATVIASCEKYGEENRHCSKDSGSCVSPACLV